VPIATGGVFAEAVLGRSNSAESGDQMPMSREAAYADQSALGYSPSGLSNLLGGLPVQPAVFQSPGGGGGMPPLRRRSRTSRSCSRRRCSRRTR
jgi:hypothetical protein